MKNYVCIKNGETIDRVFRKEADKLVLSGNWKYCPRSEWKEKVRDANRVVIAENVREATSAPHAPRNAARRAKNLKGKARKVAFETTETEKETV